MIGTHVKTSFQYMRRAPFQALAALMVLGLTFFVATLIGVVVYGSEQVLREFETRPQIIAFIKKDATEEKQEEFKKMLELDSRVRDVKVVTKEEAVEIYKDATQENPLLGELVSPAIFPSSIEFSVTDLSHAQNIIDSIKDNEIVDSVSFTASLGGESELGEVLNRLKTITYYVRVGALVAVGILAITSFLVLMVVVGMRIQTRRGEIETLSLIGATRGFIRMPIMMEAINYAIFGALIGWVLAATVILYATPSILSYFGGIEVLPREALTFFTLLASILAGELVVSVIIALSGSLIAISRAFK